MVGCCASWTNQLESTRFTAEDAVMYIVEDQVNPRPARHDTAVIVNIQGLAYLQAHKIVR